MPCESVSCPAPRLDFVSPQAQRSLDGQELSHELALICRASALACSNYLHRARTRVREADLKVDHHDPVTEFDRAVETALATILGRFVPGSLMLGEEHGVQLLDGSDTAVAEGITFPPVDAHVDARSLASRVRWVVDPIDGTSNFAAGDEYFGTSVAAQLDGTTVAAAIHIPCFSRTMWANATRGWLETPAGFFPLDSAGPTTESEATLYTYFPTARDLRKYGQTAFACFSQIVDAMRAVRRPGACALDLGRLACGHSGAVFATQVKPWDVAAGAHLVRVSGGRVWHSVPGEDEPFRSGGVGAGVLASARGVEVPSLEAVWDQLGLQRL